MLSRFAKVELLVHGLVAYGQSLKHKLLFLKVMEWLVIACIFFLGGSLYFVFEIYFEKPIAALLVAGSYLVMTTLGFAIMKLIAPRRHRANLQTIFADFFRR